MDCLSEGFGIARGMRPRTKARAPAYAGQRRFGPRR